MTPGMGAMAWRSTATIFASDLSPDSPLKGWETYLQEKMIVFGR